MHTLIHQNKIKEMIEATQQNPLESVRKKNPKIDRCFSFRGAKSWNAYAAECKQASSLSSFTLSLDNPIWVSDCNGGVYSMYLL